MLRRAACALLGLALVACTATPVPIPPSADPDRIEVFADGEGRSVVRGEPGAISGQAEMLRASSSEGSAEGDTGDDGSFFLVVPGLPSDVFYLEGLLPTEDRFLVAVTGGPGGDAQVADPGGDADGDGSPDAVDCAPMDPMLSGSRCAPLCVAERCDDMRDNDCDGDINEGCAGTVCGGGADCAVGHECAGGVCAVIACMTQAQCPAGFVCPIGVNQCTRLGPDADGDGFRVPEDCDDASPARHPGAPELCDMIDNDCDGLVDEDGACMSGCRVDSDCPLGSVCPMGQCQAMACMVDSDCPMGSACTAGVCGAMRVDGDSDGYAPPADCDDANPAVRPGVPEVCGNMVDDNCDGVLDDGCMSSCATDADCPFTFQCLMGTCIRSACMVDSDCPMGALCVGSECQATTGADADMDGSSPPADCNDMVPTTFPGAAELCNMVDDDCDGRIDESCTMM